MVKDLERIRMALGAERFSFWGPSYGTSIAVQYAEEYPNRVRAFSIEDVLATDTDGSTLFKEVAVSYEWSFNAFLDDCAANPPVSGGSGGIPARIAAWYMPSELSARLPYSVVSTWLSCADFLRLGR